MARAMIKELRNCWCKSFRNFFLTLRRKVCESVAVFSSPVSYWDVFFEYENPTPTGESKYIMLETCKKTH